MKWPWSKKCQHDWEGAANYYDRDLRIFLHLMYCRICGLTIIEER